MQTIPTRRYFFPILTAFAFFWIPRLFFIYKAPTYVFDHLRLKDILASIIFDGATFSYALIPFIFFLLLSLIPWTSKIFRRVSEFFLMAAVFLLFFASFAEIFFIDEFTSRFNFIAVDYLVYTNEVLQNMWESYPIGWILVGILIILLPIFYWIFLPLARSLENKKRHALIFSLVVISVNVLSFLFISEDRLISGTSAFYEELSKNSIHTFVHAYNHNEINYYKFYKSIDPIEASKNVYRDLKTLDGATGLNSEQEDSTSIVRNIKFSGAPKKLNVVLVLMESMSAKFMKSYGSQLNITPNLDRLTTEGVWFPELYATGTRTVRGIEALLIAIPPTPGQSIVRRELGSKIFQLGTIFKKNNYSLNFIYGGHSYFDNMKTFFEDNGYKINDEGTFATEDIHFSNAWGVSDEDLFDQVLKNGDAETKAGKAFFDVVLTTSNHRPYTYPDNKIDIPSQTGREGAVKYADFAIGEFLNKAKNKPWFDRTIFIFAADHNASVSGGETLELSDYLVPVIFYSPKNLPPQKLSGMASQIDLAPSLLSFLNISYQSKFWGTNLFRERPGRAFIATYQKIGFVKGDQQVTLTPKKMIELKDLKNPNNRQVFNESDDSLKVPVILDAVSYYSAASYWYSHKLLQEDAPATDKNLR